MAKKLMINIRYACSNSTIHISELNLFLNERNEANSILTISKKKKKKIILTYTHYRR